MSHDIQKIRREQQRWTILLTLNNGRPSPVSEHLMMGVLCAETPDTTQIECRRELQYLESRDLIKITRPPNGTNWLAELTRYGVDIAEYTVDCEPGIARPQKYW